MQDIVTIVQSLGFPIAMCLLCFWRMTKQDENFHATLTELKYSVDAQTELLNTLSEKIKAGD